MDCSRVDPRRLLAALEIVIEEDEGKELVARCPSGRHQDRNPSWTMRVGGARNGVFHCRSCGFDGDAFTLAMHVLGVGFPAAKGWVEDNALARREEREVASRLALDLRMPELTAPFRLPDGVERGPLEGWPSPPRDYLAKRGVTPDQVQFWRIGYATEGKLAGRIVIPTLDAEGRARSYDARSFSGQPVRYLTPSAEERPDPAAVFGEFGWDGQETVVVCEGSLNALAVEREIAVNVAALRGSRLEPGAVVKLLTEFQAFVLLTDSDHAGDRAAGELAAVLRSRRVARARLPEGTDPANAPPGLLKLFVNAALAELW